MLDSRILHKMYMEVLNLKINELLEESISYHTVHNSLMGKLSDYHPYIDLCTNYSLGEMLEFADLRKFTKIYFSMDKVFINDRNYSKEILQLYLKNYISINKIVVRNEEKIKKLKSQRLDYRRYLNIIKIFNRGITEAMIEEGYIFNPGGAFGKLYITKITYDTPRVNLPESMKVRRKLIAEGRQPYSGKEEKEYIEKGLEYKGIKYFVYYPKVDFMVRWKRMEILRQYFPFVGEFIYRPPATNFENSYHFKMRKFTRDNRNRALMLFDRPEDYERTKAS